VKDTISPSLEPLGRREFLGLSAAAGVSLLASGLPVRAETPGARKPNILVIVADDLGNADLGCQGGKEIPTPNIDSIAKNGVRFTNGYVSCPVCSPTRAGLLTGRYQQRFGHEFNPGNPGPGDPYFETFGLPLEEKTIADSLKAQGYRTGMVGKWHLGFAPPYHPLKRGFEEFYGFLGGSHPYLEPGKKGKPAILRGVEPVEEETYLTEAFAREAAAFVERRKADPFFLYLTFNAVHAPIEAPQKYLDRFPSIEDKTHRTYAAMLSALDDAVGVVLSKLRETGIENDTLIFFVSDNGGPTPATTASNGPLKATKGTVYEGGIRVPFLIQWKAQLPMGKEDDRPVIALDILPTAVGASGASVPPEQRVDGVDLVPFVLGSKEGTPHERLFWRFGERRAMREGNLKLVRIGENPAELYDLSKDIGEAEDLAEEKPELVKKLSEAYEGWNSQLAAPRWPGKERPKWQDESETKRPRRRKARKER
jgi:arylsulfatase A-like enzyme